MIYLKKKKVDWAYSCHAYEVFNKNQNHYYYNVFLEKFSHQWARK